MSTEKKPAVGAAGRTSQSKSNVRNLITKERAVLNALTLSPLTGREAWRDLGDSCLNTTVCKIQEKYGLRVDRELIDADGRYGTVKIARYWLSPDEKAKARKILGREAA